MAKKMSKRGVKGENIAAAFLASNGYEIVARNWRGKGNLRSPEIDIIARQGEMIVFVEVKSYMSNTFDQPEYRLDKFKTSRLALAAEAFIAQQNLQGFSYRFDLIIVDLRKSRAQVNHIPDAFRANESY